MLNYLYQIIIKQFERKLVHCYSRRLNIGDTRIQFTHMRNSSHEGHWTKTVLAELQRIEEIIYGVVMCGPSYGPPSEPSRSEPPARPPPARLSPAQPAPRLRLSVFVC